MSLPSDNQLVVMHSHISTYHHRMYKNVINSYVRDNKFTFTPFCYSLPSWMYSMLIHPHDSASINWQLWPDANKKPTRESNQAIKTTKLVARKKMAAPTYFTSTQALLSLMTAYTLILQINAQTCKCVQHNVDFSTCNRGQAGYRSHDHHDIGLVGSCLPQVPAK